MEVYDASFKRGAKSLGISILTIALIVMVPLAMLVLTGELTLGIIVKSLSLDNSIFRMYVVCSLSMGIVSFWLGLLGAQSWLWSNYLKRAAVIVVCGLLIAIVDSLLVVFFV